MRSLLFSLTVIATLFAAISCEKRQSSQNLIIVDSVQIKDDLPSFFEIEFKNEQAKLDDWISQFYDEAKEAEETEQEYHNGISESEEDDIQSDETFSISDADDEINAENYAFIISVLKQEISVEKLQKALARRKIPFYIVYDDKNRNYLFMLASFRTYDEAKDFRKKFIDDVNINQSEKKLWRDLDINIYDSFITKLTKD